MSWEAIEAAMLHSRALPTPRAVLFALAYHANQQNAEAWPSVPTIAQRTGLGQRTVREGLRALEAAGEITRIGNAAGGRAKSTRYRITLLTDPPNPAGAAALHEGETRQLPPQTRQLTTVNPAAAAAEPKGTKKNSARARAADRGAPRGNGNTPHLDAAHDGRAGAAAYAGPSACHDCGTVTQLNQGKCEPCYERWETKVFAAHEACQETP